MMGGATKRPSGFDAAGFGEALCKQLRPAREAILARLDEEAAAAAAATSLGGGDVLRGGSTASAPSRRTVELQGSPWRRPLLGKLSGTGRRQQVPATVEPLHPGGAYEELLLPLQPPGERRRWRSARDAALGEEPAAGAAEGRRRRGPPLLWKLPPKHRGIPGIGFPWGAAKEPAISTEARRPVARPTTYKEYMELLDKVLPESMQPPGDESWKAQFKEGMSALDMLRQLNLAARPKRSRVPPLTSEEKALADRSLAGDANGSDVVASRFSVDLTRKQLACLRPGQWLNDEVINFYYKLLQERSKKLAGGPKCWFPNSFFWPKLSGAGHDNYSFKEVKRWTIKAKIDIFELDYVLFPMNIGESHWAMGVIDIRENGFRYFDSMFCKPHRNFVPFLRHYVQDEHKARKGKEIQGIEDWDLIRHKTPVPQQNNGYDCGVFTCFFADYVSAGRELEFDQDDMPDLRLRLCARVVRADENW